MDNKYPISLASKPSIINADLLEFKEPTIIFNNVVTDKSTILTAVKGKAAIYQWTHKETGKSYVGSAIELDKRLKNYYNKSYLNCH